MSKAKVGKVAKVVAKGKKSKYPQLEKYSGVGRVVREAIMEGFGWASTLVKVKEKFPEAKTSKKCYYWYRSHLRMDDNLSPAKASK